MQQKNIQEIKWNIRQEEFDVNEKVLEEPEECRESGTGKRKRDLMKRIRSTKNFTTV